MIGALSSASPPRRTTERMHRIKLSALLALAICTPPVTAQLTIGFGPQPRPVRELVSSAPVLGFPWLVSYPPPAPQTPVIVVETRPAATEAREEVRPASPLLIEWRGDRFVRIRGDETPAVPLDYIQTTPVARSASRALAPTVLIFRDGHREEASEYTIFQGVLYRRVDYWSNGYGMKKIQLSWLDVPATVQANQERGIKFALPSSANEVMIRP